MEPLTASLRRAVLLVLLAAVGGAAWSWWRERQALPTVTDPPQWPPFDAPTVDAPETAAATPATAPATAPAQRWVAPNADGSTPDGFPVKAKESSGIYHVPGGRFHERTRADRCYASAEDAEADGYRRSKT